MNDRQAMRITELLLGCCSGSADPKEMAELESLLDRNPEALEYSVEILMDLNYFHCLTQTPLSEPQPAEELTGPCMSELDPQQQMALLDDFAEYEKHAAALKITPPPEPTAEPPIEKRPTKQPGPAANKYSLAAAILSAAAILMIIVYAHLAPPPPSEVATVTDCLDVEWAAAGPIGTGSRIVSNSRPIRLVRGIAKLRTDEMVEVVLEAPTEFTFRSSSEISLRYGKLFARVSEQGSGFSVVTPNSRIVDLGTEFGVLSHIDGNTEVHLYKGRANLFAGRQQKRKVSELLSAGAARKVDSFTSNIREIALEERALIRDIDSKTGFIWRGQKTVRLADLILGGSGFGTAVQTQIELDPQTGKIAQNPVAGYRKGPEAFIPIPDNPYLDGIFVPGSSNGDLQVTSAGHLFRDCPQTSGLYYSNIICFKEWTFFEPLQKTFDQSIRKVDDCGLLYLHSNIGLTIDLNAVRRAFPGLRLASFSSFVGIIRMGENTPEFSEADLWILIDGQLRSSRRALRAEEGYPVRIDLADQDQFLTLVVTDSGRAYVDGQPANHTDTCGFAEPVFELVKP